MSKQPKLINCVRQPDSGRLYYVNGEMLPVIRSVEDYSHGGHTITLTLTIDCFAFSDPQHYSRQQFVPEEQIPGLYGCPDIRGKT